MIEKAHRVDHVESFLDYMRHEKDASQHTLNAYSRDLIQFAGFVKNGSEFDPANVDHLMLRRYLGHLRQSGMSKSTISRKLASLRSFYRYMCRTGVLENNPVEIGRASCRERV